MALTVAQNITNFDTYTGDSSTTRITEAERFQFITEATVWLIEELGNDHTVDTVTIKYLDTVNYYKITSTVADLLQGADLRRLETEQLRTSAPKSSREMAEEIGQEATEDSWAIERRDGDTFLAINFIPDNRKVPVTDFDSLTSGGGTWVVDSTGSDATNLTQDINEFKQGTASLNFDVDVSQSGNDLATIYNPNVATADLTANEDLASYLFDVYIPDVTNFTSITLFWGSDKSATPATAANFWSATVTTDIDGNAFTDGWNEIKIDWSASTRTGSPDVTAILYYQVDYNYTGSQIDDTDFRIDDLRLANPEDLIFHYSSFFVGTDSAGTTDLLAFTATTDIPFYSAQYDQYKYAVAHKAASLAFFSLRLRVEGREEENEAIDGLDRQRKIFPDSKVSEVKSFKVMGNSFPKLRGRRSGRIINL